MAKKWTKQLWIPLVWGCGVTCILGILQGIGQISIGGIVALGVVGTLAFVFGAVGLGWHRAPHPIGVPIRLAIIFLLSGAIVGAICWYVWPKQTGSSQVAKSQLAPEKEIVEQHTTEDTVAVKVKKIPRLEVNLVLGADKGIGIDAIVDCKKAVVHPARTGQRS